MVRSRIYTNVGMLGAYFFERVGAMAGCMVRGEIIFERSNIYFYSPTQTNLAIRK